MRRVFWLAGSLTGRGTEEARLLFPLIIVALVGALLMGSSLNTFSLGEETAVSLGLRVGLVAIMRRHYFYIPGGVRSCNSWPNRVCRVGGPSYSPWSSRLGLSMGHHHVPHCRPMPSLRGRHCRSDGGFAA